MGRMFTVFIFIRMCFVKTSVFLVIVLVAVRIGADKTNNATEYLKNTTRHMVERKYTKTFPVPSRCSPDEYGPNCTVCLPQDSCIHGHYSCDQTSGHKICLPGWQGEHCVESAVNIHLVPCEKNVCRNGGTCARGKCCCVQGFTGILCEIEELECTNQTCMHGGICKDHVGGYECLCREGYTGKTCETHVFQQNLRTTPSRDSICQAHTCLNNGTCYEDSYFIYCVCVPGFLGDKCEKAIPVEPSQNGCPLHHYGLECKTVCYPADSCANGHYICNPSTGRKICLTGWIGNECDTRLLPQTLDTECPPHIGCKNDGQCYTGGCCCKHNYSGQFCNVESIGCLSSPCSNGGVCNATQNGYFCTCDGNYTGKHCQTPILYPIPSSVVGSDLVLSTTQNSLKLSVQTISPYTLTTPLQQSPSVNITSHQNHLLPSQQESLHYSMTDHAETLSSTQTNVNIHHSSHRPNTKHTLHYMDFDQSLASISTLTDTSVFSTEMNPSSSLVPSLSSQFVSATSSISLEPFTIKESMDTVKPSVSPTSMETIKSSVSPTSMDTIKHSVSPTSMDTIKHSVSPTSMNTTKPSVSPTSMNTIKPSVSPTSMNTIKPLISPTSMENIKSSLSPTSMDTKKSSLSPTSINTIKPSLLPTSVNTIKSSLSPTSINIIKPSLSPTSMDTIKSSLSPTSRNTIKPSLSPTSVNTIKSSISPTPTDSKKSSISPTPIDTTLTARIELSPAPDSSNVLHSATVNTHSITNMSKHIKNSFNTSSISSLQTLVASSYLTSSTSGTHLKFSTAQLSELSTPSLLDSKTATSNTQVIISQTLSLVNTASMSFFTQVSSGLVSSSESSKHKTNVFSSSLLSTLSSVTPSISPSSSTGSASTFSTNSNIRTSVPSYISAGIHDGVITLKKNSETILASKSSKVSNIYDSTKTVLSPSFSSVSSSERSHTIEMTSSVHRKTAVNTKFAASQSILNESLGTAPQSQDVLDWWWILLIVAAIIVLLILIIIGICCIVQRRRRDSRAILNTPDAIMAFDKEHFSTKPNFSNPSYYSDDDSDTDSVKTDLYIVNDV